MVCIEDLVPRNHLLRDIDKALDFSFIYELVRDLYCADNGRPSIDPVVLFKIVLIQYTFGIRSMRQTIKEIEVNMAYRWFLGYSMTEPIPHFTTFGKNYTRRFANTDVFEKIFEQILKPGFFKKYEYAYDEYFDCYLCPNDQILKYSTTNREGYREYKSDPKICEACPYRQQCTLSKNMTKVVTHHVWEEYMERAEDVRHSPKGKEIYSLRKETVERIFADAKVKHGLRYTQFRGLAKLRVQALLTFSCMNLKKLASWKRKNRLLPVFSAFLRQLNGFLLHNIKTRRQASA